MKTRILLPLALLLCVAATQPANSSRPIIGDYVEARTASVFAGACHYNGELVTTGRDAILAWNITSGSWNGTDLSNLKAMAAVSSPANLGDENAARKCELVIDTSASTAQTQAFVDLLKSRCLPQTGQIISIRRARVTFTRTGRAYDVKAAGFATLAVQPMPNDECCAQPSLVWYSPLVHLDHRKVGFTTAAEYTAGTIGDPWQQSGDNSAFYGSFTF